MDWRRTGLPALTIGWASLRQEIPVRFTYANSELEENATNAQAAISRLETTPYIGTDGANSSWSKPWLLQGTSQPW
jgi:hypothetical protein